MIDVRKGNQRLNIHEGMETGHEISQRAGWVSSRHDGLGGFEPARNTAAECFAGCDSLECLRRLSTQWNEMRSTRDGPVERPSRLSMVGAGLAEHFWHELSASSS